MAPMRRLRVTRAGALASIALLALGVAACGEKDEPAVDESTQAAPDPASFPATDGGSLEDVLADGQQTNDLVVAPAGSVYTVGKNRFAFAVFEPDRTQVTDADVAIYAAHGPTGKAEGPYPAKVESLATEPAFTAQTTSGDPDAAKAVYVSEIPFDQPGEWRLVAIVSGADGNYSSVRVQSIKVRSPSQDRDPRGRRAGAEDRHPDRGRRRQHPADRHAGPAGHDARRRLRRRRRQEARRAALRDARALREPRLRARWSTSPSR